MKRTGAWLINMRDTEPARWAELARALIVATVGLGWWIIDAEAINSIVSAVGLIASILLSRWVRSSVYSQRTVTRLLNRPTPRPTPRRPSLLRDDDPAADQPQDPPRPATPA